MFTQASTDFLWQIALNNHREWFEANKALYRQDIQAPLKALGEEVFATVVAKFPDKGLKLKVARIHRDARRVKDGQPYKTAMWFSIERPDEALWSGKPVFWFEIAREHYAYGLGYYAAKALTMEKFRKRLDTFPGQFEKLITCAKNFDISGEEYKRKKPCAHPVFEPWYNRKSFTLLQTYPNDQRLYSDTLGAAIGEGFLELMPMYDYLVTLDKDPHPRGEV